MSSPKVPSRSATKHDPVTSSTHTAIHSSPSHTPDDEKGMDHVIDIHPVPSAALDALGVFHSTLGIPPPKPYKESKSLFGRKKPAKQPPNPSKLSNANQGVYHSVTTSEKWAKFRYHACNSFVAIAMFLQIIVGASVTAFGAGGADHVVITVFGAASTALASLLAVLKSQGLPNRLRQDWNGWRELREYIEEREREIEMKSTGKLEGEFDVWAEIKAIEARYNAVRLTAEANRPDTYIKVPAPAPAHPPS